MCVNTRSTPAVWNITNKTERYQRPNLAFVLAEVSGCKFEYITILHYINVYNELKEVQHKLEKLKALKKVEYPRLNWEWYHMYYYLLAGETPAGNAYPANKRKEKMVAFVRKSNMKIFCLLYPQSIYSLECGWRRVSATFQDPRTPVQLNLKVRRPGWCRKEWTSGGNGSIMWKQYLIFRTSQYLTYSDKHTCWELSCSRFILNRIAYDPTALWFANWTFANPLPRSYPLGT